jgi:hypothetical protein
LRGAGGRVLAGCFLLRMILLFHRQPASCFLLIVIVTQFTMLADFEDHSRLL